MRAGSIAVLVTVLVTTAAAAAPQIAGQPRIGHPAGATIGNPAPRGLDGIDRAIKDGRRDGQLTRREAKQLRRERDAITAARDRYRGGGLSASESAEIETRSAVLRSQVATQRSR